MDEKTKIMNDIMGQFRAMEAKSGGSLPPHWLGLTYIPRLNAKERDYLGAAIEQLIQDGLVEDQQGDLALTAKGADTLD